MLSRLFRRRLFAELQPDEVEIFGGAIVDDRGLKSDHNTPRINWLIETKLIKIAVAGGGWETLYQDPADGRYWEQTYLESAMHGGGPPSLLYISPDAAKAKYDLLSP